MKMKTSFNKKEYPLGVLADKVLSCAEEVYLDLGNEFSDEIYKNAQSLAMDQQGMVYTRDYDMPVYYKGMHAGFHRVNFFVERKLFVEIKSTIKTEDVNLARKYLEAYDIEMALLINFSSHELKFNSVTKPNANSNCNFQIVN
jgi:GxxExxY protein